MEGRVLVIKHIIFVIFFLKDNSKRTWTQNPKFTLNFNEAVGPGWIKTTLVIAESNWKAKIKVNNI